MTCDEMAEVFAEWNKGELDSFLVEITRDILGSTLHARCLASRTRARAY